ncbi:MAG: LysR family transcriptional regulator [Lachnospiraceae bacterium]|nr:LysR family transcriptional regulator [Lachnospiraceae bacterium]
MTLQQLLYAIAIADAGSLNKAADVLYVTQPSLTSAMQELEREFDMTIFHRSGRGVTLTREGADFILYARQIYSQYEDFMQKFGAEKRLKKKFSVSTQHYSFAVKAFVELVKEYDTTEYEVGIMESRTRDIINDVAAMKSEIGVLYLSDFNRKAIEKLLRSSNLEFCHLINCDAYIYMWKGHPLADRKSLSFADLDPYPCLSFDQGESGSFYYAEEILSTVEYKRTIKANDRATMLNLMVGLNGYTLCSGIICEELNGSDYVAVPFDSSSTELDSRMEIGYITRKNSIQSSIASLYVQKMKEYLNI